MKKMPNISKARKLLKYKPKIKKLEKKPKRKLKVRKPKERKKIRAAIKKIKHKKILKKIAKPAKGLKPKPAPSKKPGFFGRFFGARPKEEILPLKPAIVEKPKLKIEKKKAEKLIKNIEKLRKKRELMLKKKEIILKRKALLKKKEEKAKKEIKPFKIPKLKRKRPKKIAKPLKPVIKSKRAGFLGKLFGAKKEKPPEIKPLEPPKTKEIFPEKPEVFAEKEKIKIHVPEIKLELKKEKKPAKSKKIETEERPHIKLNVPGFDVLLEEGIPAGNSVLVEGGPGVGKCVHFSTPIFMNGKIQKAIDIYNWARKHGKTIQQNEEEHIIKVSGEVPSLNKQTLKIENINDFFVYRQKYAGNLIKIKTASGRQITVTPEHPFITVGKDVEKIKAKNIAIGNKIAIPRIIEQTNKEVSIDNSCLREFIRTKGGYRLKNTSNSFKPVKKFTPELMEWLGMLQAEGHMRKNWLQFTSSISAERKRFKFLTKKLFGVDKFYIPEPITVRVQNTSLIKYIEKAVGLKIGKNREKTIPEKIMQVSKKLKAVYLKHYFGQDGTFSGHYIELQNANLETINRLAYMLLEFGIVARISTKITNSAEYGRLIITGIEFLKGFYDEIGFSNKDKNERIKKYLKDKEGNTNIDIIPCKQILRDVISDSGLSINEIARLSKVGRRMISRYKIGERNPSRTMVKKMANGLGNYINKLTADGGLNRNLLENVRLLGTLSEGEVLWDEVADVKIENNRHGYVYDLSVPKNHTFIAGNGGIVIHNTIFCLQTAYNLCKQGKKVLYMSFEEPEERLKGHMRNFGWDVDELERKGLIRIRRFDALDVARSVEALLSEAKKELLIEVHPMMFPRDFDPDVVCVDSLTSIAAAFTGEESRFRIYMEQLFRYLEKTNMTSFLIREVSNPAHLGQVYVEKFEAISFLSDGIIVLYNVIYENGEREFAIEVLKMRGEKIDRRIVKMNITSKGIVVYPKQDVTDRHHIKYSLT